MRNVLVVVAVAGYALAFGWQASAASMTIKGKVVDEGCSMEDKTHHGGAGHQMPPDCAIECAKKGEPLALLTTDGKVYRITGGLAANKNAKLIPHMAHTVEITGEVSEKNGKMEIAADTLTMVAK